MRRSGVDAPLAIHNLKLCGRSGIDRGAARQAHNLNVAGPSNLDDFCFWTMTFRLLRHHHVYWNDDLAIDRLPIVACEFHDSVGENLIEKAGIRPDVVFIRLVIAV